MLKEQKVGGVALDVLKGEEGILYHECTQKTIGHPYPSVLQKMPNVTVTPHTAYHMDRILVDTASNII